MTCLRLLRAIPEMHYNPLIYESLVFDKLPPGTTLGRGHIGKAHNSSAPQSGGCYPPARGLEWWGREGTHGTGAYRLPRTAQDGCRLPTPRAPRSHSPAYSPGS